MITKVDATNARYGQEFYFKARDGKVKRCRVTGKCQTWKTRPLDFRLPVKFGLYESSAITHYNGQYFANSPEDAEKLDIIHGG